MVLVNMLNIKTLGNQEKGLSSVAIICVILDSTGKDGVGVSLMQWRDHKVGSWHGLGLEFLFHAYFTALGILADHSV